VRGPTVLQAFLIAVSGFALAFFGCLGVVSDLNKTHGGLTNFGQIWVVLLIVGLVLLAGGGLVVTFYVIRAIWDSLTRRKPATPPPGEK
jgi:hypothetical protein